jgi:trimeric autotransporter adhesin
MKSITTKTLKTFLLLIAICNLQTAFSQAPQKMSYQAIIRNSSNVLIANTSVTIKVSIFLGQNSAPAVYSEVHLVATNYNGLATFEIGTGTVLSGSFSAIDWANGVYYVKTETDPTAGTNYTIVGVSQLTSVPYALSSLDNKWANSANGISYNAGNVAIGSSTPNNFFFSDTSKFLQINNPSSATTSDAKLVLSTSSTASSGSIGGIVFANPNGSAVEPRFAYIGGNFVATNTLDYGGSLSFYTKGSNGFLNNNMTIKNTGNVGNVGIGTSDPTTKLEVNGFTKLGTDAPAIKVKKITGTTAPNESGYVDISHGLTLSKILSVSVLVDAGFLIPESYDQNGYDFSYYLGSNNIVVFNSVANSYSILSKPIRVLITYEE